MMKQNIQKLTQISYLSIAWGVLAVALAMTLTTQSASAQTRTQGTTQSNPPEIYLTVSQYELALIQVLSEICPPMLNSTQKTQLNRAYNNQLRIFMPTSPNPQQTLRILTGQRDYRIVLQNVRAWTKSYPAAENRALCREFASMG